MRVLQVLVTVNKLGTKKLDKTQTTICQIPLPDNSNDLAAIDKTFSTFKKWGNQDGESAEGIPIYWIGEKPDLMQAVIEGLKFQARADGQARVKEELREEDGPVQGGRGRKAYQIIAAA